MDTKRLDRINLMNKGVEKLLERRLYNIEKQKQQTIRALVRTQLYLRFELNQRNEERFQLILKKQALREKLKIIAKLLKPNKQSDIKDGDSSEPATKELRTSIGIQRKGHVQNVTRQPNLRAPTPYSNNPGNRNQSPQPSQDRRPRRRLKTTRSPTMSRRVASAGKSCTATGRIATESPNALNRSSTNQAIQQHHRSPVVPASIGFAQTVNKQRPLTTSGILQIGDDRILSFRSVDVAKSGNRNKPKSAKERSSADKFAPTEDTAEPTKIHCYEKTPVRPDPPNPRRFSNTQFKSQEPVVEARRRRQKAENQHVAFQVWNFIGYRPLGVAI